MIVLAVLTSLRQIAVVRRLIWFHAELFAGLAVQTRPGFLHFIEHII